MSLPAVPIDNYLPYMPDVTRCETSLRELNLMWRLIEARTSRIASSHGESVRRPAGISSISSARS